MAYVTNKTGSAIVLPDLGLTIPSGATKYDISKNLVSYSSDLESRLTSGDLVFVNQDDTEDSSDIAVNRLKSLLSGGIGYYYLKQEVDDLLANVSSGAHDHDTRYYTKTEIDAMGSGVTPHDHDGVYSPTNHNHDGVYAPVTHDHNTQYYTKTEIDAMGSGVTPHNHDGVYALINHDHDRDYASSSHDHNTQYSSITHTHADYASATHDHSGTYLTEQQIEGLILDTVPEMPPLNYKYVKLGSSFSGTGWTYTKLEPKLISQSSDFELYSGSKTVTAVISWFITCRVPSSVYHTFKYRVTMFDGTNTTILVDNSERPNATNENRPLSGHMPVELTYGANTTYEFQIEAASENQYGSYLISNLILSIDPKAIY